MRVLYFSPRICWPTISGAHLRDYYFARTLARNTDLTYVGLVNEEASAQAEQLRQRLEPQQGTKVYALRRDAGYRPVNILRGLVGPTPLNVLNYTSDKVVAALDPILREQAFDVIQIESMHLIAYARHIRKVAPRTRLILDWHNIESEILARYADNDSNPLRAIYARRTSVLSRGIEDDLLRLCDAHTVCSERERQVLQSRVADTRIEVVGNGVDCRVFANGVEASEKRDVLFMGRMDYHANIDAAVYFVTTTWPLIHARRPELRLAIVGAQPPGAVRSLASDNVVVTGTVPDVRPYYHNALVSVVPLRVGGGTRLKVLEAMAAGTPVVSTTLGAEGLDITHGKDILIADTPQAMADAVVSMQPESSQRLTMIANARRLVQATYDWNVVGEILLRLHAEQAEMGAACLEAR
jgi:polysaccharide biosynthesis protein PslH